MEPIENDQDKKEKNPSEKENLENTTNEIEAKKEVPAEIINNSQTTTNEDEVTTNNAQSYSEKQDVKKLENVQPTSETVTTGASSTEKECEKESPNQLP